MICPARSRLPAKSSSSATSLPPTPYGKPFWFAYLANSFVMIAIALLYRYADFVTYLGGNELHLGWIVGIGMIGSLLMRLFLGTAIDKYGPGLIWLGSVILFASSCYAHLWIDNYQNPTIYFWRIAFCCATAGIFGASMTFVSSRVPVPRIAEMIGMLGTAGFLGIVVGTGLGDFLFGDGVIQRQQIDRMFLLAGLLSTIAIGFAWLATRKHTPVMQKNRPPLVWLLRRYYPGSVLLAGVAMGIGLGLPGTFLRMYAAELDIPRIAIFFGVYSFTAIVVRLLTRRLSQKIGLEPIILMGIGGLAVSQLLFLLVSQSWHLVFPGIGYGMSHAILFPAVIAAGVRAFPNRYRGLGTTLLLATFDLGILIGAPVVGAILHYSRYFGLPSYPTMFIAVAGALALVGIFYGCTCRSNRIYRKNIDRIQIPRPSVPVTVPSVPFVESVPMTTTPPTITTCTTDNR